MNLIGKVGPKSFLVKIFSIFIPFYLITIFFITATNFFLVDSQKIDSEKEEINSYNKKFKVDMDDIIRTFFSEIVFLAKTSYPIVASDFKLEGQFYGVATNFIPKNMGLVLLDFNKKTVHNSLVKFPQEFFEIYRENLYTNNYTIKEQYIFYSEPFLRNKKSVDTGYLIGYMKLNFLLEFLRKNFQGNGPRLKHIFYDVNFNIRSNKIIPSLTIKIINKSISSYKRKTIAYIFIFIGFRLFFSIKTKLLVARQAFS